MSYIGKTPTPAPLTASDITDGIISESKLGANAITTGKITDGTVAQADISDQAINEAKMQVSNSPTNGYFLSAQSGNTGGMTWAEPGGGAWVLLNTQTVSGTPSSVESGAVFSSTYDTYVIVFRRFHNSAGGGIDFQIGTSSAYTTSGYQWAGSGARADGSGLVTGNTGQSAIQLLGGSNSSYHCNSSQDCVSGVIWVHNPNNTARTSIHAELSWENATDTDAHINNIAGHPSTDTQYDRWKIFPSTGTWRTETIFQTFGVVNS